MSYKVEYSSDGNEVCIIPIVGIPTDDMFALIKSFKKQRFNHHIPSDSRCGYTFVKSPKSTPVQFDQRQPPGLPHPL